MTTQILTLEHFAGCVGQSFDLDLGTSTISVTLSNAELLAGTISPGVRREPFSLLFRSASAVLLPQKIYRLSNQALGVLDVFLVPVARDRNGIIYQAVFS